MAATVLLVLSLAAAGGFAYRSHAAQAPAPGYPQQPPAPANVQKELEELRREVERLRRRLEQVDPQFKARAEALQTIARGIKMLRASVGNDKAKQAAVAEFEQAFGRLIPRLDGKAPPFDTTFGTTWATTTTITGEVRAVSPEGLVSLSVSSSVGLRRGQLLGVARIDPRPGYLGELQLLDVKDNLAVGKIKLWPGQTIRPKDRVTFKLSESQLQPYLNVFPAK
jgi:hypothetical protein